MLPPPFIMYYMGCCNDCLTCDIAFNAVMPLSRASTRGSYSRIEGVTMWDTSVRVCYHICLCGISSISLRVEGQLFSPAYDSGYWSWRGPLFTMSEEQRHGHHQSSAMAWCCCSLQPPLPAALLRHATTSGTSRTCKRGELPRMMWRRPCLLEGARDTPRHHFRPRR